MKFKLGYFPFWKDLHEYLFSLTKRHPERIFAFMKKAKSKHSVQFVSQRAIRERVRMQQLEWRHQAPSPGTAPNISAARSLAFGTVWVDLRFILIYFVHSLARCVLRYQKSLRGVIFWFGEHAKRLPYKLMVIPSSLYIISASKRFHRKVLLSDSQGNLCCCLDLSLGGKDC